MTCTRECSSQRGHSSLQTSGAFNPVVHCPPSNLSVTDRNILRDETVFRDPHLFKPERYLEPVDNEMAKRRDPKNYTFGFGRRVRLVYLLSESLHNMTPSLQVCPGRHLAQSSAWILMASFLATMNISKAVDANGRQIKQDIKYENSVFR